MRPSSSQLQKSSGDPDEIKSHVQAKYNACQDVLRGLKEAKPEDRRVRAFLKNADAISKMYLTDHVVVDLVPRTEMLLLAKTLLDEASKDLPNDWALCCNVGSLSLRLAIAARDAKKWPESDEHFSNAERELSRVVKT